MSHDIKNLVLHGIAIIDAQTEIVEIDSSPFRQPFGKKPLLNNKKKSSNNFQLLQVGNHCDGFGNRGVNAFCEMHVNVQRCTGACGTCRTEIDVYRYNVDSRSFPPPSFFYRQLSFSVFFFIHLSRSSPHTRPFAHEVFVGVWRYMPNTTMQQFI